MRARVTFERGLSMADQPTERTLVILVPGEPVPQNQGKVGRWKAKDGREGVTVRQPAKVRHYKVDLQERMYRAAVDSGNWPAGQVRGSYFGSAPLAVAIIAVFALPASKHRKREPIPRRLHTGRYGNCDNLTKAIGDAGEAVLWDDDGQIADLRVRKFWGAQGEAPFVEIRVRALENQGLSANGERPGSHPGDLAGSIPASPTNLGGERERSSALTFNQMTEGSIPSAPTNSTQPPADQPVLFEEEKDVEA